ncbi:Syntaxin-3, partial [Durusdinium trenchii]
PAQSRGLSGGLDGTASRSALAFSSPPAAPNLEDSFMREFFTAVRELQGLLDKGRSNVKEMGVILEEALQATTQEREAEVSENLNKLVEETNQQVADVKRGLELLKLRSEEEAAKQPNSAQIKIRTNMQQAMAKKHQQLLMDFQKAQMNFKRTLEKRQLREMQILMPEATEEQRQEMISDGQTAALMVAKKMAGTHALLLDEVRRIQDKHKDIVRLEQSIADLAQMFEEMAVLVDAQGEMLDAIEVHVNNTKGYTAKAEQELIKTRKLMLQGRKWTCCLSIVILIVLLIILGPILIR